MNHLRSQEQNIVDIDIVQTLIPDIIYYTNKMTSTNQIKNITQHTNQ